MSAQPANTDIKIYRNIRTTRDYRRHDSIAAIIKKLRTAVAVIPGAETLVGVLTRDSAVTDASPYMGQAAAGASRGFPIVVGINKQTSFKKLQTSLANVDFAFQIGSDFFVTTTTLTTDDYKSARAITPDLS
jgi:hypothetical protein